MEKMQNILDRLRIKANVINEYCNGTIVRYDIELVDGTKVSKIESYSTEISLFMKSYGKPIIKVLPELGIVTIEFLISKPKEVNFLNLINEFNSKKNILNIPIILGKSHAGEDLVVDLSDMPHLLIAGTTGSGKSILLHSILNSIIEKDNVRLALVDPKKVEFMYYENLNKENLMYPVATTPEDSLMILSDLVNEMESRFTEISKSGCINIESFNKKNNNKMDYIVVVIDEFSDLMHSSKKEFQSAVCLLAQKSRACGIHIIIATQRPSSDVVTGLIKANFPARISFMLPSSIDSRTILGCGGAEKLLGRGDGILNSTGNSMVRFQGSFISGDEIIDRCERNKKRTLFRVINKVFGF